MATQTVILKADDIRYDREHVVSPRWQRFIAFIDTRDIAAGLGLIGNGLEDAPEEFCDRIRRLDASPRFEIWHHGYDHVLNTPDERGVTVSEFRGTSLEHQRRHLRRTQELAADRLAITLRTFGAPGNAIDENTTRALDEIPEITAWLYGDPASTKHILKRSINLEYPTHNPDREAFAAHFRRDVTPLVLQGHPNSWDDGRFEQFAGIIDDLVDAGVTFKTPNQYSQQRGKGEDA